MVALHPLDGYADDAAAARAALIIERIGKADVGVGDVKRLERLYDVDGCIKDMGFIQHFSTKRADGVNRPPM